MDLKAHTQQNTVYEIFESGVSFQAFCLQKTEICSPEIQQRIRCSSAADASLLTEVAVMEDVGLNVCFLVYVYLQSTFVS